MNKFNIGDKVAMHGRFGGIVKRIITLDPPKWEPNGKTRYEYVVFHSVGMGIYKEENLIENVETAKPYGYAK